MKRIKLLIVCIILILTTAPTFSKTQITLEMAQEKLNHLKALKASGATEDEEGLDIDSEIED